MHRTTFVYVVMELMWLYLMTVYGTVWADSDGSGRRMPIAMSRRLKEKDDRWALSLREWKRFIGEVHMDAARLARKIFVMVDNY